MEYSLKGKIERFNGIVNEFMEELSLEPVQSLEALNRKFRVWLEEGYVHRPHSGLGGKTPFEAYRENAKKVRFASGDECRQVFLWEQTRSVDKTGAVRLQGRVFDAGADLINKKVDLRYDPFDLSVIEIWRNGLFVRKAEPLVIAEFVPEKPKANAENHTTANSRLLGAYEAKNQQRDKERHKAIVFGDIPEESDTSIQGGDRHV